jgi:hypothetical protein
MDAIVEEEKLEDTFPYLDNVTIAGHNQAEHDKNVNRFLSAVKSRNLSLNDSKTIKSVTSINVLGYNVGSGSVKPDTERLRPLQEFPPPTNAASLRRAMGMFAYYAKWIPNFSDKIQPLIKNATFPLNRVASSFQSLEKGIIKYNLAIY